MFVQVFIERAKSLTHEYYLVHLYFAGEQYFKFKYLDGMMQPSLSALVRCRQLHLAFFIFLKMSVLAVLVGSS